MSLPTKENRVSLRKITVKSLHVLFPLCVLKANVWKILSKLLVKMGMLLSFSIPRHIAHVLARFLGRTLCVNSECIVIGDEFLCNSTPVCPESEDACVVGVPFVVHCFIVLRLDSSMREKCMYATESSLSQEISCDEDTGECNETELPDCDGKQTGETQAIEHFDVSESVSY